MVLIVCFVALFLVMVLTRPRVEAPRVERTKAPEPVVPARPVVDEETRAAVHEAGHALLALRCSLVSRVSCITTEPGADMPTTRAFVGYTLSRRHPDAAWCDIVIGLGGLAAEMMELGRFSSGRTKGDLAEARECAAKVLAGPHSLPPWGTCLERKRPPFAAMFTEPLTEDELRVLHAAYDFAREVLEVNRGQHAQLTAMLLACKTLHEAEIETWFGSRGMLRVLGGFSRAKFV